LVSAQIINNVFPLFFLIIAVILSIRKHLKEDKDRAYIENDKPVAYYAHHNQ
jgi:hypothetical protein